MTTLFVVADTSCGKRKITSRYGKIVGGENAIKGEFPWLVSLTRRGGHVCGGTVISEKFILTAGHCLCTGLNQGIFKPAALKVTMSQYDLTIKNSEAYQMNVKAITIHPGYVCSQPKDDIAILELEKVIHWSDSVGPACLPSEEESQAARNFVTVAGWGWTHEDSSKGQRATILQKAKLSLINMRDCREWYASQGKDIKIQDSHICAGYKQGEIDACWGDSGGPLMSNIDKNGNQTIVIGVVSTGIGCARPYLPGLYTRISDYISWIQKTIQK
ncbi:serine protease 30-like [Diorhabda carinulata]|uniref:serine protease 30-like n=1 Tax=Diorhabda carinulata TaxID=1163345 RepID=UPI0025A1787A|nr:serine protease 30-like [Diorhabda carinulata]